MNQSLLSTVAGIYFLLAFPLQAQVRSDLYFDPTDQRIHADVASQIDQWRLNLIVSALGSGVDCIPGFTGLYGANLQTAYEIDQLIKGDLLEVLTFDSAGQSQGPGRLVSGNRGMVPVRGITFDGDIVFQGKSEGPYWLSFNVLGPQLKEGIYRTEIWARGEERLGIEVAIGPDGTGSILQFTEVPHGQNFPKNAGNMFRFVATEPAQEEEPYLAPVEKTEWEKRDTESKWVYFKKSISDGANLKNWVQFLSIEKDYELLEMIGLYQINALNHFGVGNALSKGNAPGWLRLVHWIRGDVPPSLGHGWTVMDGLFLAEDQQDIVYSWIKAHKLEGVYATILSTMNGREVKPKIVDVSKYSSPYQIETMIKALDIPAEFEELPVDSIQSEPGKIYLHQALRSIDMMVVASRLTNPEVQKKLTALRSHTHERIRQAVYLSYTHLDATLVPVDLLKVVNDGNETAKVREAALLAHSYRSNGWEIYPDLLKVALDPSHPAWEAALSRLGEGLGFGFIETKLSEIKVDDEAKVKLINTTRNAIQKRVQEIKRDDNAVNGYIETLLVRAAWLKYKKDPLADPYFAWLTNEASTLRGRLTKFFETRLPEITLINISELNEGAPASTTTELNRILQELGAKLK